MMTFGACLSPSLCPSFLLFLNKGIQLCEQSVTNILCIGETAWKLGTVNRDRCTGIRVVYKLGLGLVTPLENITKDEI